jgi:hypothetical protein
MYFHISISLILFGTKLIQSRGIEKFRAFLNRKNFLKLEIFNILEVPELSPILSKRVQPEGSPYLLVCHTIAGTKPVFFQWNKNGINLSNSPESNFEIEINDDKLYSQFSIKSVRRSDSGNYSCIARNAFGSDIQSTLLIVKGLV